MPVEGTYFPGASEHSDPWDALSTHFPNPKVLRSLKRTTLQEKYFLPMGYEFVIPDTKTTVNKPPLGCIAIYRAALAYGLGFPLHKIILEILNKYELASV